jgi:putative ABC transport system permease protein
VKLLILIFKNLWRNKLRTVLTAMAIITLVAIFSMILSVLRFLDSSMEAKSRDIREVITERYRIPSRFDRSHVDRIVGKGSVLNTELREVKGFHSENYATWHFIVFSLDPEMKDKGKIFFAIATEPEKIPYMIDGLEGFDQKLCDLVRNPPRSNLPNQGILVGADRLKRLGRRVGDTLTVRSLSHRSGDAKRSPLEMQFEIVGVLPADSRWTEGAFIDYEYLNRVMHKENCELDGKVNLAWLMVDDQKSANDVIGVIERDETVGRELKCEVASSAVGRFLEPMKDILRGVKFLLIPAIAVVMTVIVANAISITVRERTKEIAVLKVLGFSRRQVLTLVLGEGVLLGAVCGLLSGAMTIVLVNFVAGGVKIPIGFFPVFFIPWHALWWGAALGGTAAFLGGIIPAWGGVSVKVSEIFAKVA